MNILEAITQLKDDLKTWVTNNLNALNSKIDEKTIPIDQELDDKSLNPVQNRAITAKINNIDSRLGEIPVSKQIEDAIAKNGPNFSGDYNDLTNAPSINENNPDEMVIIDNFGNIVLKVDKQGLHTTSVTTNGQLLATEEYVENALLNFQLPDIQGTEIASKEYVNNSIKIAKDEIGENLESDDKDFKIIDNYGNIICIIDENGIHSSGITVDGLDIIELIESKTPIKGQNYWTAADKTEIVNEVLTSLPMWNGGKF